MLSVSATAFLYNWRGSVGSRGSSEKLSGVWYADAIIDNGAGG